MQPMYTQARAIKAKLLFNKAMMREVAIAEYSYQLAKIEVGWAKRACDVLADEVWIGFVVAQK